MKSKLRLINGSVLFHDNETTVTGIFMPMAILYEPQK